MATATAKKTLTSEKYPGWAISRVGVGDGASYLMTRPGHVYAIRVDHADGRGWEGTLLTRQGGEWRPAWTPFNHCVLGCTREATRREAAIEACKAKGARR